ncbi:MAG: lipopolysaccharide biosynthesis protein, partial [Acidimicrobiia bacterium]
MFQSIRRLFVSLVIYGMGDVATSLVSFLLLPLFTRYLSPQDYGIIGLLLVVEVVTKIVFRWGIDASFMRMYYDCKNEREQQRLASTIFFFLLAVNGTLLAFALAAAPALSRHVFGNAAYATPLRFVLLNTFVVGFYFLPFHIMRIEGRPTRFITLTFIRSSATVLC